jgi:hypothetical protein
MIAGFAADVLEGRSAGKLTDNDRDAIQDALDRMAACAVPGNDALPAGRERGFSRRSPSSVDPPAAHVRARRGAASKSAAKAPTTSPRICGGLYAGPEDGPVRAHRHFVVFVVLAVLDDKGALGEADVNAL